MSFVLNTDLTEQQIKKRQKKIQEIPPLKLSNHLEVVLIY
jgi:hypothetical protein